MSGPTTEQLRTEAYWRSVISAELSERADQMERDSWNKTTGIALASIVRDAAMKVGQMPDRPRVYDREPPAEVTEVYDRDGDGWRRTGDGWAATVDGPGGEVIGFPDLRDAWGPITGRPGGA